MGLIAAVLQNTIGYTVDKASEQKAQSSIKGIENLAKKALGFIGVSLSVAGATSFIKSCVSAASQVEEMQNKFDVVFQGINEEVDAWAENYADAINRNKNDIKTYLADQQNLLVGFGMTRQEGAELSKQMTTLALDLASFANIDEKSSVDAMTKAVMGESEAAKRLGAVLNESTRAQAMETLGLKGKYDSLDQLTKMQVNYQAILQQSPDAIGDCERSMGSYESTMRGFNSKLKELKELIGQFFMPAAKKILDIGTRGIIKLREAITKFKDFADRVGGAERLLKFLAVTIAAVMAVLKFDKIKKGLSDIVSLLTKINLKTLAIVAGIILLALIVEDFISFMQGKESVLGDLLSANGIDPEEVRAKIKKIWESVKTTFGKIKDFLKTTWENIKSTAKSIWEPISNFFKENGDDIKNKLQRVWNAIKTIVVTVWNVIKNTIVQRLQDIKAVMSPILDAIKNFWDKWGENIKSAAARHFQGALANISSVLNIIVSVFEAFASLLTGDWNGLWESIKNILSEAWNIIKNSFQTLWDTVNQLTGGKLGQLKNTIVNGFNAAIDWIKSLPAQAYQWGVDMIQGIIDGITSMIDTVVGTVKNVATKIGEFLHFSRPDKGPLRDYEQWMPDFMGGLADGINKAKSKVVGAVKGLAGDMSLGNVVANVTGFASRGAFGATARTAGNTTNSRKVINQKVEFNNQFYGDRAAQLNTASTMQRGAADATAELARALAYS
nr:MAG TPA: tail tape measure protein [Caudoviricetes sp.]